MDTRNSTDEDVSGWLTPRQALEILDAIFHESRLSKNELLQRLQGGMVRAICHHTTIAGQRLKTGVLNQIGAEDWNRVGEYDDVWITGTLAGCEYQERAYESAKAIRFFDVRFDPIEINRIVAPHQVLPIKPSPPAKDISLLNFD